jgi:hypothetical protein
MWLLLTIVAVAPSQQPKIRRGLLREIVDYTANVEARAFAEEAARARPSAPPGAGDPAAFHLPRGDPKGRLLGVASGRRPCHPGRVMLVCSGPGRVCSPALCASSLIDGGGGWTAVVRVGLCRISTGVWCSPGLC